MFFAFDDQAFGGRRFDDYTDVAQELETEPPACV
jgi:hypothetical protein